VHRLSDETAARDGRKDGCAGQYDFSERAWHDEIPWLSDTR
jgi:hypothetical protein